MTDYADLEVVGGLTEWAEAFTQKRAYPGSELFKEAMRALGTSVGIVTVQEDGRVLGLTINSFCSVSANPPQVLVSLAHGASCREPVLRRRRFGLSILGTQHRQLAELGAVPGGPKRIDMFCERRGADGPVVVAGALASFDCAVSQTFEVSDHTLVIGLVEQIIVGEDVSSPLLYHDRTFKQLGGGVERRVVEDAPPFSQRAEEIDATTGKKSSHEQET
jgi:flavin reductase (DIM6/NTAB) family NADH-FMN oxidoreductase RutF